MRGRDAAGGRDLARASRSRGGRVRAEGDLDFRGTLGVDKERRSASRDPADASSSTPTPTTEQLDTLLRLTERYCVVLQTIARAPQLTVTRAT